MRLIMIGLVTLTACGRLEQVGRAPDFTPLEGSYQHHAMYSNALPEDVVPQGPGDASSLWTAGRSSLFGDRRATRRGDILTVVIEIDDSAVIKNSIDRSRSGKETMGVPSLFGIPQVVDGELPAGASSAEAVATCRVPHDCAVI